MNRKLKTVSCVLIVMSCLCFAQGIAVLTLGRGTRKSGPYKESSSNS